MDYILIVGAKSDIAKDIARVYAKNGYNLYLAARDTEFLKDLENDLKIRNNIDVQLKNLDIVNFDSHKGFYQSLSPKPLGVIVVAGYMADQKECELDFAKTLNTINVNYTGAISFCNIVANDFETKGKGFIIGISSVAGDRGRGSNYIYGSSKAGFTAYLSGLRNRLYKHNIQVLTVKPGFVNTKMTEHLSLPQLLTANTQDIAKDIFAAQQKNKDEIYMKSIWEFIMFIITHIPESIFKRLNL